jgi:MYXO-CTERM domain-containing protein
MNDGYTGGNAAISPAYWIGLNASSTAVNVGVYSSPAQSGAFPLTRTGNVVDFPQDMTATTLDVTKAITFNLAYDGTALTGTASDGTNSFNINKTVNLATVLGGPTAYVGFTGASAGSTISAFSFTPVPEPASGALALGSLGTLLLLRRRSR